MSQVYRDLGALYEIFAGTTMLETFVIIDPNTGVAADMSDTTIYNTGTVNIFDAQGNAIGSSAVVIFTDRIAGQSFVQATLGPFTNNQAGNWQGAVKILNNLGIQILAQEFNFKIKEIY